jgi:hypothetical protein
MPSLTLVEAQKLQQNPLLAGVIESIVTVNPMYQFLPFDQIVGNALSYNRENAIAGVAPLGIGGGSNTIPAGAKTNATVTPVTTPLKAIIGDALVDHFVQTTMGTQNDQKAVQLASKAKAMGREFQRQMILGDEGTVSTEFDGLKQLFPSGHAQVVDHNEADLSFELLDQLISMVKAKDGQVDFFMMPDAAIRKYFQKLRAQGGANITETRTLPGGQSIPVYRGVPLFRNDWIGTAAGTDDGTKTVCDVYAGCFDDGSRKVGLAGLTSQVNSGIFVTEVGEAEDTNETITRVRFYTGLAVFSELGLARAYDVNVKLA